MFPCCFHFFFKKCLGYVDSTLKLAPEHLGGSSLVDKMASALLNTGDGETSNVLVDLLGFDGWPACFALQQAAAGHICLYCFESFVHLDVFSVV